MVMKRVQSAFIKMLFEIIIGILMLQMDAYAKEHASKRTTELLAYKSSIDKNISARQKSISSHEELISINCHLPIKQEYKSKESELRQFNIIYTNYGARYPVALLFLTLPKNNSRYPPGNDKMVPEVYPTQTQKATQATIRSTEKPEILLRGPEISQSVNASFIETEEDFSRIIYFDAIPPVEGTKRRPPPVEHGSVQS